MPTSKQRVRIEWWQGVCRQCVASKIGFLDVCGCVSEQFRRDRTLTSTPMSHETVDAFAHPFSQGCSRITYSELCDSISAVLETGRLGTPVNVRLHWEFSEHTDVSASILCTAVAIADLALKLKSSTWRVRRHPTGRTLNVLGSDQRGRTLMISLVSESEPRTALSIFGNHGIVRLDNGWVDPATIPESFEHYEWFADFHAAVGE